MTDEAFTSIVDLMGLKVETYTFHDPETLQLKIKMRGRADGRSFYLGTYLDSDYIEYSSPEIARLTMKSMTRTLLRHMLEELDKPAPLITIDIKVPDDPS